MESIPTEGMMSTSTTHGKNVTTYIRLFRKMREPTYLKAVKALKAVGSPERILRSKEGRGLL